MDARPIVVVAEAGRSCRMDEGGPSGMGPSQRCLLDITPPGGAAAGGWGLVVRVAGDVWRGSGCEDDDGIPVLKRRFGTAEGICRCISGL